MKVEFSAKAAKPAASAHDAATPRQGARAKLAKVPAPAESAGQEAEQPEMSLATVADMETVAAVQEAQLMIDDPVAYEQQQIDAAMSETE